MKHFTLTEQHITLLQHANVRWDDCEAGAPAIDPVRPYGSTAVAIDVTDILGLEHTFDRDGELSCYDEAMCLHQDTEEALAIILRHGPVPGDYVCGDYGYLWEKEKMITRKAFRAELKKELDGVLLGQITETKEAVEGFLRRLREEKRIPEEWDISTKVCRNIVGGKSLIFSAEISDWLKKDG